MTDLRLVALEQTVADLRRDLDALRESALTYAGIYQRDCVYRPPSLITHRGLLWLCREPTDAVPGSGEDWRMILKSPKVRKRVLSLSGRNL